MGQETWDGGVEGTRSSPHSIAALGAQWAYGWEDLAALLREEPHGEGAESFLLPNSHDCPPHPKPAETCRVRRPAAGDGRRRAGRIRTGGWRHLPFSPIPLPSRARDRLSLGALQENVAAAVTAAKAQRADRPGARGQGPGCRGHSPGGGSSGNSSRAAIAQRRSRLMVRS